MLAPRALKDSPARKIRARAEVIFWSAREAGAFVGRSTVGPGRGEPRVGPGMVLLL